jgi:hypothetical protein
MTAGLFVEMKEAARRPLGGRVLRDQLGRQNVVEVVAVHAAGL